MLLERNGKFTMWKSKSSRLSYSLVESLPPLHQKLLECILTVNSRLYLGKVYTEEKIKELNEEEVEKLLNNYEAKLSGQMVKSLGRPIINMYSMGACSVLRITNQEALSEDLENDPFLNSALQRFTCELYYRFGSFLAPLSVGIITSRHYLLSERNKNGNGKQERTSGTSETGDNKNGGDEKTVKWARSYWSCHIPWGVRFLIWNWSHLRP